MCAAWIWSRWQNPFFLHWYSLLSFLLDQSSPFVPRSWSSIFIKLFYLVFPSYQRLLMAKLLLDVFLKYVIVLYCQSSILAIDEFLWLIYDQIKSHKSSYNQIGQSCSAMVVTCGKFSLYPGLFYSSTPVGPFLRLLPGVWTNCSHYHHRTQMSQNQTHWNLEYEKKKTLQRWNVNVSEWYNPSWFSSRTSFTDLLRVYRTLVTVKWIPCTRQTWWSGNHFTVIFSSKTHHRLMWLQLRLRRIRRRTNHIRTVLLLTVSF